MSAGRDTYLTNTSQSLIISRIVVFPLLVRTGKHGGVNSTLDYLSNQSTYINEWVVAISKSTKAEITRIDHILG